MNIEEMRKTLDLFKKDSLVEARFFTRNKMNGYFKDFDKLIANIKKFPDETHYFVLNDIKEDCYSREQSEKFLPRTTTEDRDIEGRDWVLIDADPKRISGISSTNEEKSASRLVAQKVRDYLQNQGFSSPIVADSGNGYHLLYKINTVNDDESRDAIKNFLLTLDMLFSDDTTTIDTSVFNASRVTKIYGTVARKGANTKERPHRVSKIIQVPETITQNSIMLIKKIADLYPQPPKRDYSRSNSVEFDLRAFISKHGIRISKESNCSAGVKYVLEECVFDSSHKSPDAAFIELSNGAVAYNCFHNSCQRYRWQDVRLKYEPDAYDYDKQPQRTVRPQPTLPQEQIEIKGEKFQRIKDIKRQDRSQIISIPSGIHALDKLIIGFNKGELTVWSGGNGCVDCDTEYFNGIEWKRISDYANGEKVLQYSSDGVASLVMPMAYQKYPCDYLWHLQSFYGVDQCVSDEHDLVYITSKGNLSKKRCTELLDAHKTTQHGFAGQFVTTFKYSGTGIALTDDEIRLMCAVICDGYFPKRIKKEPFCRMNLKKNAKKERIVDLLERCGVEYSIHEYNPNDSEYKTYIFRAPIVTKEFNREWYNCTNEQMMIIADEVLRWDGSNSKGRQSFSTSNKNNADFVQFVFSACGKRSVVTGRIRKNAKSRIYKNIEYRVGVTKSILSSLKNTKEKIVIPKVNARDGYKYCFTVPSGMLVLRRNGRINITGNSGKSTFLSLITLESINRGFKVAIYSGEMTGSKIKSCLHLQAAGIENNRQSKYGNAFYTPKDVGAKIDDWIDDKIWLYNNDYGSDVMSVVKDIQEHSKAHKCDVVIVDNLMSLDLSKMHGDKYEKQGDLAKNLFRFAQTNNIHVHFICHPRKAFGFLRKADISGSADITNVPDNVIMMHRVNHDFRSQASAFFSEGVAREYFGFDNVIEVMKNRDIGVQDELIGLYYEKESKRLMNTPHENKYFGWDDKLMYKVSEISDSELPWND